MAMLACRLSQGHGYFVSRSAGFINLILRTINLILRAINTSSTYPLTFCEDHSNTHDPPPPLDQVHFAVS